AGGAEPNPGGLYNPLCGDFETHDCNPDDANACRDVEVNSASSGTGADTSGSAASGSGGSGGSGGSASSETTAGGGSLGLGGQAGAPGAPGEAGAAGAGGEGDDDSAGNGSFGTGSDGAASNGSTGSSGVPGDAGPDVSVDSDADPLMPSGMACRVNVTPDGPSRGCGLAGDGRDSDPCTSAADCAGGFACVGEGNAGICRPYCCSAGQDPCASGSYCGERALLGSELEVPVCLRADNCSLSQAYPCASADECQCREGTACLVVRRDGTTTCAVPGDGQAGDACPCAWGHVCSQASGTCLKLCDTVVDDDPPQCGEGICQAAANLPGSWGVCIKTASGG
ncbi:MAG TPA: hypothetical protein VI197_28940, partial [Polyangiaceae bacterium]